MSDVQLVRVGYFIATDGIIPKPSPTPEGHERVEIITGGSVFFDNGDGGRYYGNGTIFRHREGEYTISVFEPGSPYQCLVLLFKLNEMKPCPRLSFWTRLETLPAFVKDARRAFVQDDCDLSILGDYCYSTLEWYAWQKGRSPSKEELPHNIYRSIEHIKRNLTDRLDVETLADLCGLSRPYFQNLFMKHMHMTPHTYIMKQRLQRAGDLLTASNMPVKEIAEACGFEHLESFYRAFKKYNNESPGAYRQKYLPSNWA